MALANTQGEGSPQSARNMVQWRGLETTASVVSGLTSNQGEMYVAPRVFTSGAAVDQQANLLAVAQGCPSVRPSIHP